MKPVNVLSLFNGMSCGEIALREINIPIGKYYSSEIDRFAIEQTQHNFPNTIQLGDVENWKSWDIDFSKIDLLIAGSPCQGFYFAGKQLAFDDPRSKLFFVFIDILNHIKTLNPDVKFLLENVDMKRSHMEVITRYVGVFPVNINSNLVSAQNRNRWYWTNIATKEIGLFGEIHSDIKQPNDKGILLKDIFEDQVAEKYYLSDKVLDRLINQKGRKPKDGNDKGGCITGGSGHGAGNHSDMDLICVAQRGRENGQQLEANTTGKTNCLTSVAKDNYILQRERGKNKGGLHKKKSPTLSSNAWEQNNLVLVGNIYNNGQNSQGGRVYDPNFKACTLNGEAGGGGAKTGLYLVDSPKDNNPVIQLNSSKESGGKQPFQGNRVYADYGKSPCLDIDNRKNVFTNHRIRRLTPKECSRLQTIPEWYEWIVSETQQYKMLGNGWTVDVIKHIFKSLKITSKQYIF